MFRAMLALAAAGALVLPAVASAKPATFTAQAYQTSDTHSGNTQRFAETLKVGGKVVGHDKITCKLSSATKAQCTATFTFAAGTFTVAGPLNGEKAKNDLAIVGGTGAYKGAKGVLHLDFLSATRAVETYAFS
jgi:Dirigent-like protein